MLLQPFRGHPKYQDVADLPYNSTCLSEIPSDRTDFKTLSASSDRLNSFGLLATIVLSIFRRVHSGDPVQHLLHPGLHHLSGPETHHHQGRHQMSHRLRRRIRVFFASESPWPVLAVPRCPTSPLLAIILLTHSIRGITTRKGNFAWKLRNRPSRRKVHKICCSKGDVAVATALAAVAVGTEMMTEFSDAGLHDPSLSVYCLEVPSCNMLVVRSTRPKGWRGPDIII